MFALRDVVAQDGYAVGIVGPVLLQIWRDGTPPAGARCAVERAKILAHSSDPNIGTLIVVADQAPLPGHEARAVLSDLPTELGRGVGVALAYEGGGFRGAAVRAVLSGIMMLSRHRVPHDVFPDVGEAATWLAPKVGGGTRPRGLVSAVAELRAAIPMPIASAG